MGRKTKPRSHRYKKHHKRRAPENQAFKLIKQSTQGVIGLGAFAITANAVKGIVKP